MKKVPISLIIDDPAPRVFVYYEHADTPFTADGRPLKTEVPNEFLMDFCCVMEEHGIKGKFSVVPMPGGRGDIVNGIPGFDDSEIQQWLDTVRARVSKYFSIGPEMLTHAQAVDLETGKLMDIREDAWSMKQNRQTLAPYIAKAFSLLKEVGINATGVTSPWDFGVEVEDDYAAAISDAIYQVFGKKKGWYFLRSLRHVPNARPWIAYDAGGRKMVAIPSTLDEHFWQTMDTTETSEEYVNHIADSYLTADGKQGEILDVLNTNGYPILICHWQSLFSNGLGTGLRVLNEVAHRINTHLSDRVEWMCFEEIMDLILAE